MLGHVSRLYILIAANSIVSGGEVVPIRVNGLINQYVLLSPSVGTSRPVQYVHWNFQSYIMASLVKSEFTVINNEFEGRLEILDDGRALRIGQLTLNDSGLYFVTITFMDKTKFEASYNLTVYEPVPTPSIRVEAKENSSDWCNVTLRCSIPKNASSLSYTWKYRHGDSDYQWYNNPGDTIQMSLQPESWDMEVLCIVHNPAERNNFSLATFCTNHSGKGRRTETEQIRGYYGFLALPMVPLVFLGWYLLEMKKRRRKESQRTDSEEIQYAELPMAPPNVSTQLQVHIEEDISPPVEPSEDIVYSTLRHGTD